MPIYRPSELHDFLNSLGVNPKKGLSQNFLIDGNIIRKIIAAAKVNANDVILEVGSGPGCLSEEILNAGAKLIAVDKDPIMTEALKRLKTKDNDLEIFNSDILEFPIEKKFAEVLPKGQKGKILGNLPYHLTTPILVQLVQLHECVSTVVVMVQEEVARRFTAKPGTSEYSSFTLFLNFFSTPRYAFTVSRNCFYPAPKVDSGVVVLDLHQPLEGSNQEAFFEMTRTAFGQRRKMLRSSLKDLYPPKLVEEALMKMGRDIQSRPEELSVEDFIQLFQQIQIQSLDG